ncbi:MAG TPA: SDR family oxidoreductase [Lacipirellulaceae bacterium]|nr:SDR family oxidoreductase [Lacipirellulaceae bacterium]
MNSTLVAGAYGVARAGIAAARRFDFRNRLVVITGGSRGLGLLLARRLADEGAALVLCAREKKELAIAAEELQPRCPFVVTYTTDLTQKADVNELFDRIRREVGSVDVLINNAGIIQVGPAETMSEADFARAMAIHFWAPLLCMERVLPDMRRRGEGRIVNISSVGGQIAVPHLASYCASKYALSGLSQSLRYELIKDGVYVTTVCPGPMRTGSPRHALFKGQHRAEYAWFSIGGAMPLISMNANSAARQIIRACRYGRARVTLSVPAKVGVIANTLAPELTSDLSSLVAAMLPSRGGNGRTTVQGSEAQSAWSPSVLTTLNERAAVRNNEILQLS